MIGIRAYLLATLSCLLHIGASAAQIPRVPALNGKGDFVHDYARLLDKTTMERIGQSQQQAFEKHGTPIVVVTIRRMAVYGHRGSIESLATKWFNEWKIGTANGDGGTNKGILIIVSAGDRKARIELGKDWGNKWDGYCQRVMDRDMLPNFRNGDYARGIATAAESLGQMAAKGPGGKVPRVSTSVQVKDGFAGERSGIYKYSALPTALFWLAIVVGIGLVAAGIFSPDHRKWLIGGGLGLIGIAVFTLLALLLVFALLNRGRGGTGGYSGGFSGGGFGGGSSGGGGASGSW